MDIEEFLAMTAEYDTESDNELIDLRSLDFVSSYDPHIECPICHCPFVQPVRIQCDHIFCESCLRSAITTFRSTDSDEFPCPSCRTPSTQISTNIPRLLINMCDDIRVRCPFVTNGCEELVPRGHLQSHVEKYCIYRLVPCADDTCLLTARYMDVEQADGCIHHFLKCPRCSAYVMEQDFQVNLSIL
ncbi:Zinc finger RING-type [Penicillium taxi]|uniref:Zinc finger RING-type n=1 Tax=Penicillium taxi TaxID=168475 RepID=UPI002544FD90|nr:Zinc finger RING-type [Penicillium taxi]KAJ5893734.1 Zinc finger RING-type [Penicillium taxi]